MSNKSDELKRDLEKSSRLFLGDDFISATIMAGTGYFAFVKTPEAAEKLRKVWSEVPGQTVTVESHKEELGVNRDRDGNVTRVIEGRITHYSVTALID